NGPVTRVCLGFRVNGGLWRRRGVCDLKGEFAFASSHGKLPAPHEQSLRGQFFFSLRQGLAATATRGCLPDRVNRTTPAQIRPKVIACPAVNGSPIASPIPN